MADLVQGGEESVLKGIDESPLEAYVKEAAKAAVREHREELTSTYKTAGYQAPETNFPGVVAREVMEILTPILIIHGVEKPNGNDTMRHIYVALGGKNPVNYEVQPQGSPTH